VLPVASGQLSVNLGPQSDAPESWVMAMDEAIEQEAGEENRDNQPKNDRDPSLSHFISQTPVGSAIVEAWDLLRFHFSP
jgi:hypothetical protein